MRREFILAGVLVLLSCDTSVADLIYRPINPSFGGEPFNSAHLLNLATAQKQFKEHEESSSSQSTSERFIAMLQSRLYSSLAGQVADAIFGEDAQPSGTIVFDNQQITFINTGTQIQMTVTDFSTGKVTNITIPTLSTE
ncbi:MULTISPECIES: curli assembly protein CsgF [Rhodomicrobium]|uniref:curli assembly protein CsgF n=1 Tax=Rhodomicrobium TaxID=1068 RepID=UPI000B4B4AAA|nr:MULTISPECIES: curli assembly protein CsgF [Rhodomicrobium]